MAKIDKSKQKKARQDETLPFERENYIILGVGLLVIIIGYVALSQPSDGGGFLPLTLAPILLVFGYCVVVPLGIMYRKKSKDAEPAQAAQTAEQSHS
jgi:hypothetical protein